MFSCEFYKISKSTFFAEQLLATATGYLHLNPFFLKTWENHTVNIGRPWKFPYQHLYIFQIIREN